MIRVLMEVLPHASAKKKKKIERLKGLKFRHHGSEGVKQADLQEAEVFGEGVVLHHQSSGPVPSGDHHRVAVRRILVGGWLSCAEV